MSAPTSSDTRLAKGLARRLDGGGRLLVPYLTAGFPTADDTPALMAALARAGADVIELGVPFSDPLADGPTIQGSSQVSLEGGGS
ncbi:MAG: tryptophan synthase subunit alpha, partial [Gemmatimonadetes bacterium]|nr:tryptophan synthase subunit alpha [Gemmatimonadota bacterium]